MIYLKYTIEAEASSLQDENILKSAGLEREWDSSPFSFTTNSKDEVMNAIDLLDEYNFELGWVLTKRVV